VIVSRVSGCAWAAGAGVDVGQAGAFVRHRHRVSGIPHRYCQNHFVRDLAKPVLDMDSQAKSHAQQSARMRAIERRGFGRASASGGPSVATAPCAAKSAATPNAPPLHRPRQPKRLRRSPVFERWGLVQTESA